MENTPDYYRLPSGRDAADIINECGFGEGFRLGNVIKHIIRAGKKPGEDALVDLKKARSYLDAEVKSRTGEDKFPPVYDEYGQEVDFSSCKQDDSPRTEDEKRGISPDAQVASIYVPGESIPDIQILNPKGRIWVEDEVADKTITLCFGGGLQSVYDLKAERLLFDRGEWIGTDCDRKVLDIPAGCDGFGCDEVVCEVKKGTIRLSVTAYDGEHFICPKIDICPFHPKFPIMYMRNAFVNGKHWEAK